jgi:hypothetical protein
MAAVDLLDPLASPWIPAQPPRRVVAQPWVAPLEAAEKRLLLAALHHPRIVREPALLEAISELLPAAHDPLRFTSFPTQLQVSNDGVRVSKHPGDRWGNYRTAICTSAPMTCGVHYAEFRLIEKAGWIRVGVVNAVLRHPSLMDEYAHEPRTSDTGRSGSRAFDALGGGSATASAMGWGYNVALGSCWHNSGFVDWVGQRVTETGDVVGLLLDVDHGCLDVFVNGEKLGRMVDHSVSLANIAIVSPSMGGDGVTESNALCWMVELHDAADQVEIVGKQAPQLH